MKSFLVLVVSVSLGGAVWGILAGNEPAGTRADATVAPVDAAWYAALPSDPDDATEAFLARMPAAARSRGEALGATRYVILPIRIVTLIAAVALIMFTGAAMRIREWAMRLTRIVPVQDALVAGQWFAALYLLHIPIDTYAGYIRFRNAGFADIPYLEWLTDATLNWGILTAFYVVGVVAIMALIRRREDTWPGWAAGVYVVLSSTYVLISPTVIEPLFNTLTPLTPGPQKEMILSLARANGVPASDVFVQDASRQSSLLNAHVSGFAGTAQIVLDDNTIVGTSDSEIKFVMAHEIGHYVLAHTVKGIVFDAVVTGIGMFLVAWGMRRLIGRFGRRWRIAGAGDIGALPVLWGLYLLWGFVVLPINNSLTRQQEIEADYYGLNASQEPFAQGEFMIRDADTGEADPSPLVEWLFYHHPSPRNRIHTAMRWRAEHMRDD